MSYPVASIWVLEAMQWGSPPRQLHFCSYSTRGAPLLLPRSLRRALHGRLVGTGGCLLVLDLQIPRDIILLNCRLCDPPSHLDSLSESVCVRCTYRSYGSSGGGGAEGRPCVVGRRTQIIVVDSCLAGDVGSIPVSKVCFAMQSKRIRSDLVSHISSSLAQAMPVGESSSSGNRSRSLLVTGARGAGMDEVIEGAVHSMMPSGSFSPPFSGSRGGGDGVSPYAAADMQDVKLENELDVRILHLRPSHLSAVGKENADGYMLHVLNLACALAQRERVLVLLHDVDSYFPNSGRNGDSGTDNPLAKMVLKFLSELSVLGHLRISVAASACDATRIPTGLFDSVVEVDSIAYGGKLIAMRMLVEDVCLSKGLSALDVAVVVRRLEDCISSSSASPQQSRPLPGLASFLWSCIGMLRDLEAMNDFNKQSMQKGDTSGSHSGLGLSNVCGQSVLKTSVRDALVFPRRYSAIYKAFGIQPPSGILMYGPPGTGKTLMAKEIAKELRGGFYSLKLNEVVRGHIGEGEKMLRLFMSQAKANAPCVVFIDEFQSIFASREAADGDSTSAVGVSLTAALATALDDITAWNANAGTQSLITVLAASNEPWSIDSAFLRPGRLDKCILVGPLEADGVEELLSKEFEQFSIADDVGTDVDFRSFFGEMGRRWAGKCTGAQWRHVAKGIKRAVLKDNRDNYFGILCESPAKMFKLDAAKLNTLAEVSLKSTETSVEKYLHFESMR